MWSYRNDPRQENQLENTGPEARPGPGTPEETESESGLLAGIKLHA